MAQYQFGETQNKASYQGQILNFQQCQALVYTQTGDASSAQCASTPAACILEKNRNRTVVAGSKRTAL